MQREAKQSNSWRLGMGPTHRPELAATERVEKGESWAARRLDGPGELPGPR
jgi:hypothetical protein